MTMPEDVKAPETQPSNDPTKDPTYQAYLLKQKAEKYVAEKEKDDAFAPLLSAGLKDDLLSNPAILTNEVAFNFAVEKAKKTVLAASQQKPPAQQADTQKPPQQQTQTQGGDQEKFLRGMSVEDIMKQGNVSVGVAVSAKIAAGYSGQVDMS